MSYFTVEGGHSFCGEVTIMGNKNEALPCIAAALLSKKNVVLDNIPPIGDITSQCTIAQALGARCTWKAENQLHIETEQIITDTLPLELSTKIRGSILFASALLARTKRAIVPSPGGDTIGRRRTDTHFLALQALGAKLTIEKKFETDGAVTTLFCLQAPKGLIGADIFLDEASVTATENAIIAASAAQGISTIYNAACEPHVQGLCRMLEKMGVGISGIGSNSLRIEGISDFSPVQHRIGSDYIEAGSFIGLAAATGSELVLSNVQLEHMRMIAYQFKRIGIEIEPDHTQGQLLIASRQKLEIQNDIGGAIPKIEDAPWPAFPADLTSVLLTTATQCKGVCLIHEKMFESRLFFADWLIAMGARIVLCDPHRAVVVGPSQLHGTTVSSPDIRAGMALVIAALAAKGKTIIHNIEQIDRGYHKIDERLRAIGAHIHRTISE